MCEIRLEKRRFATNSMVPPSNREVHMVQFDAIVINLTITQEHIFGEDIEITVKRENTDKPKFFEDALNYISTYGM